MATAHDPDPSDPRLRPAVRSPRVNMGMIISVILLVCLGLLAMCAVRMPPASEPPQVLPDAEPAP